MNVGILGTGHVGTALAAGLSRAGHAVKLGSRDPASARAEAAKGVTVGTYPEAVAFGEAVVLAVPFKAARETIAAVGAAAFSGKTVVDATNPFPPPEGWGSSTSCAEEIARLVPGAKVVKAFNHVFAHLMATGRLGEAKLLALVAGDDVHAKNVASRLAADIGFDVVNAGPLRSARFMEGMALMNIHLAYDRGMGPDIGFVLARK